MSEPRVDPRNSSLPPTPEEIEAWAEREHQRRAAWLAGPSDEEKQEWARRYRRRAAFGFEESRLGPTRQEIDQWAEREHKRREAWLAGPTSAEKQEWARQHRSAAPEATDQPLPPSEEEIEGWCAHERQRRQEWLAGPSEEEKQEWTRRQAGGLLDDLMSFPGMALPSDVSEAAQRLLRDVELAGKGTFYALSRVPRSVWSYLVRAGEVFEEEFYQKPRRSRIRF